MKTKKVVLITGCSSGIGLETSVSLAQKVEFVVYATIRDINKKIVLENAFSKTNGRGILRIKHLDVTNEETINNTVSEIIKEENKLDVLINNAAMAIGGFSETVTDEQIKKIFDTNFFGIIRLFRAVLPFMRQQSSGHIISLSSVSAISPPTGLGFYAASKSALESFHRSEAPMLAQWNIKLTLLQIGTIRTNNLHMAEKVELGTRDYYKKPGEEDLYRKQVLSKKSNFINYVYENGAPVSEVVEKIISIITTPKNNLAPIIQTPGEAEILANIYSRDPYGLKQFEDECLQTVEYLYGNK